MSKFKVGDRVKTSGKCDCALCKGVEGLIGVVTEIATTGTDYSLYRVQFEGQEKPEPFREIQLISVDTAEQLSLFV